MKHEKIIIIDFGGQYAHLLASRIRRNKVCSEIHQPDEISIPDLQNSNVRGIILSGGPQSVYEKNSPHIDPKIFDLGIPVLGICYGHQFMSQNLGGEVVSGKLGKKEFGKSFLTHTQNCPLFAGIPPESVFWMSHGDEVKSLPNDFEVVGVTDVCANAAIYNPRKKLFGIQFHPEVTHSEFGKKLLKNFCKICKVKGDWTIQKFIEEESEKIREKVGNKNVFLFVSGGVDSTVSFAFLSKILGKNRVKGLFINNGLLRKNEVDFVHKSLKNIGTDVTVLDASEKFIKNLENVFDAEQKRKIIGESFLEIQNEFFSENNLHDDWILAQGTIYPDTIESGATKHSNTIKTHHNRIPQIHKMIEEGKIIEPVAELYKDEVRHLGEVLKLPSELVSRHPFPGPGLGVRILCNENQTKNQDLFKTFDFNNEKITILPIKSVGVQGDFRTYKHPAILHTKNLDDLENFNYLQKFSTKLINQNDEINRVIICLNKIIPNFENHQTKTCFVDNSRIKNLQIADQIIHDTMLEMNVYQNVWQFPVILAPISFDNHGEESIILRPINSIDAMSAVVGDLPDDFYKKVTKKILQNNQISAVFLDITSKPPGTIEWE